jgi:hypothetical protein
MPLRSTPAAALLLGALLSACATVPDDAALPYGPLRVNQPEGADFYVAQDGAFVPVEVTAEALVFRLQNRPFQVGTNSPQLNVCLTLAPAPEVRTEPGGFRASCLSFAMQGAVERDADYLLVYPGTEWSDGNTALQAGHNKAAKPLPGYANAYQVANLLCPASPGVSLSRFRGTLHGYIAVHKGPKLRKQDVMPIRLVFGG